MDTAQVEEYVLEVGLAQLDVLVAQLKRWVQEKRYGAAYVTVGDLLNLLHGIRQPIKNLER